MADPGNISGYFNTVGEPHARDFPQRRVGLLRRGRVYARTNAALLRTALQRRTGGLPARWSPPVTHKLVKSRHEPSLKSYFRLGWALQARQKTRTDSTACVYG